MDDILTEIEAFRRAHDLAETTFGRLAANDTMLVAQIRNGRELRRKTVARVRHFMATYRPSQQAAA